MVSFILMERRFESGRALDVMVGVDCGVDESLRALFVAVFSQI